MQGSSVIGIDFGTLHCYIGGIRGGGIDVVLDESSARAISSAVSFRDKSRYSGVLAEPMIITNFKNTVTYIKSMIGRPFKDPKVQKLLSRLPLDATEGTDGFVQIKVNYDGADMYCSPVQLLVMLLYKLKTTAEMSLNTKVTEVVISVPIYFTDTQRRAVADAATIIGLNVLKISSDVAATAVSYGYYKKNISKTAENGLYVAIIDFGHTSLQASICQFKDSSLQVVAAAYDDEIGGDEFDLLLTEHFIRIFNSKYKMEVGSKSRHFLKLLQASEKLKKTMSVNSNVLSLSLDVFKDDIDVSATICRQEFEEMCSGLYERVVGVLDCVIGRSGIEKSQLNCVEIIGGSSRIPKFIEIVEQVFGMSVNRTMNADEAAARGCAIQGAILSPSLRSAPYSILDYLPFEIVVHSIPPTTDGTDLLLSLPIGTSLPAGRRLTLNYTTSFKLVVLYGQDTPVYTKLIGQFAVTLDQPGEVEIKLIVDKNGIVKVTNALRVERYTEEVQETPKPSTPTKTDNGEVTSEGVPKEEAMDVQNGVPPEVIMKTVQRRRVINLDVLSETSSLSREVMDSMFETEGNIQMLSSLEDEKDALKNRLEELILHFRSSMESDLMPFVNPEHVSEISQLLDSSEEWLYNEGENALKRDYVDKLSRIEAYSMPALTRAAEYSRLPHIMDELGAQLSRVSEGIKLIDAGEYDYLSEDERATVRSVTNDIMKWFESAYVSCHKMCYYVDPSVTVAQVGERLNTINSQIIPILSKPRPQVVPPVVEEAEPMTTDEKVADGEADKVPMDVE